MKKTSLRDIFKINWVYLEDNDPTALWHQADGWGDIILKSGKHLGQYHRSGLVTFEGFHASLYCDGSEWVRLGKLVVKRLVSEPHFRKNLIYQIRSHADSLFQWSDSVSKKNLAGFSVKELLQLHREGLRVSGDLYSWALLPVYADFTEGILSNFLIDLLKQRGIDQVRANKAFVLLTTPSKMSYFQREEQELRNIAKMIKHGHSTSAVCEKVKAHVKKWEFLGCVFLGRPMRATYFTRRLKQILQHIEETSTPLHKIAIKLPERELDLFNAVAELTWLKDYRKAALMKYYYTADKVCKALAKRSKIRYRDILMMQESELVQAINIGVLPDNMRQRHQQCVMVILNGKMPAFIITGVQSKRIVKWLNQGRRIDKQSEICGQVAYPGVVRGRVHIIRTEKESRRLKLGEILVTEMTYPDLLPAMRRAAGFVTDTGGITCHAAIVARELKKPCVIGTKIATKVLKDGDRVEVDADKGVVRKI